MNCHIAYTRILRDWPASNGGGGARITRGGNTQNGDTTPLPCRLHVKPLYVTLILDEGLLSKILARCSFYAHRSVWFEFFHFHGILDHLILLHRLGLLVLLCPTLSSRESRSTLSFNREDFTSSVTRIAFTNLSPTTLDIKLYTACLALQCQQCKEKCNLNYLSQFGSCTLLGDVMSTFMNVDEQVFTTIHDRACRSSRVRTNYGSKLTVHEQS